MYIACMLKAAVAGASGYAGGEILRLLLSHPNIEVGAVFASSNAGSRLGDVAPHLTPLADRMLEPTAPERLAEHDVVFLALPHGASAALVQQLDETAGGDPGKSPVLIDCGADYRLRDEQAWVKFYGSEHAGTWPYGMPELVRADGSKCRDDLTAARRIAVPGCYPTSVSLAMAPGFAAGLMKPEVVVVAASGTSGAGKSLKPNLLGAEVMGAMSPYGVGGGHRHTPEMNQNLSAAAGTDVSVSFTPTLAPMPRGILATCSAPLADGVSTADVRVAWEKAYADEPFVHLLSEGQWPSTASVLGSNCALMQVAVDETVGRVIVVSVIDNLTKGTAGGAVQSANLALGLDETAGLPQAAVAP